MPQAVRGSVDQGRVEMDGAHLDAEVWPDYDMVWDRTKKWEPLEDQASG
jgi:hypothetical protein